MMAGSEALCHNPLELHDDYKFKKDETVLLQLVMYLSPAEDSNSNDNTATDNTNDNTNDTDNAPPPAPEGVMLPGSSRGETLTTTSTNHEDGHFVLRLTGGGGD